MAEKKSSRSARPQNLKTGAPSGQNSSWTRFSAIDEPDKKEKTPVSMKSPKPVKSEIPFQDTRQIEPVKRQTVSPSSESPKKKRSARPSATASYKKAEPKAAPPPKFMEHLILKKTTEHSDSTATESSSFSLQNEVNSPEINEKNKPKENILPTLGLFVLFFLSLILFCFSILFLGKCVRSSGITLSSLFSKEKISQQADLNSESQKEETTEASFESAAEETPAENTELPDENTQIADEAAKDSEALLADTDESEDTGEEAAEVPFSTSITVSVCGDCTLGTEESFDYSSSLNQFYDNYGSSYFFHNVKDIFEADDLTIANLECSFTEAEIRSDHTFCFKAPASYTQILLDGSVEAVNLANNHSRDFLEQGLNDTRAALDDAGITHFGYEETAVMEIKGVKIGLVGTYELVEGIGIEAQMKANIEKVQAEGAQIIIVIFHWGNELDVVPNYNQYYLAHKAIDYGADLVCGGHAHIIQGMETYQGKNILYGLANFCFGGNVYPAERDTLIYQQTFTVNENGLVDDLVTNIIPCFVSSNPNFNNYQPTPATGDSIQEILNKFTQRTNMIPDYSE